ncbi:MAG: hypothetical protein US83_C0009G0007 [Candidatus Falkowbacteria bacterium GW2011_GWC2_38_22]|uniref:Uncharacterized protein n=1 Tax=Candidatus Falkowbacteria bacterium GW2011_GWE1_38_31 TaxID=1618638 RepID=A0A0G0JQS8_9BACT|nr:MAG: hypothetical protein US73_C0012G0007 [Candidatus Falkowbacteria bacterium GW2011_GWF2_38_1205]KKQ61101.1 MAG: hypothetical protein US83_C0009G0007 [Candidatus Falkowbacteria bacterium GW2011_GWC2_38_22]KKQ63171.1 MAG: hypothetical protein US84_C0008G0064 [Candidatus Falkowbacteria bacterium GW2011_GWF1_38_22]KKQ65366.1 MAG: hypothetical protein US87_C0008G0062 [Candidatus Falkowbacteria bacterium GW2011_GWE2_38_254]KKQ69943.1 MAG: hypothetical protein US91_C0008G0063 [Candidatus Falkowb
MHINKNIIHKELKISLLFFIIIIFFSFLITLFPVSLSQIANALTGNYSKNAGDTLGINDWNNLDNDFLAKSGDTMQGDLSMGNRKISDLANPTNNGDAVNKGTLDTAIAGVVSNSLGIRDGVGDLKVFCGRTLPGATNWIQGAQGKYVDIDISAGDFAEGSMPYVFTTIGGLGMQWVSRGATSISATNSATLNNLDDIFRVYILDDNGVDWGTFISRGWYVNWCTFGR